MFALMGRAPRSHHHGRPQDRPERPGELAHAGQAAAHGQPARPPLHSPDGGREAEDKQREKCERRFRGWGLAANIASALATIFAAAFAAGAYEASLRAVGEARSQVEAARTANGIARDALVAADRPWVRVDVSMNGPVRTSLKGTNFSLRFTLKNVGHSPAMLVALHASMVLDAQATDLLADQRKLCGPLRAGAPQSVGDGKFLFPDQEVVLVRGTSFDLSRANVDRWSLTGAPRSLKLQLSPAVVGCVAYRFASGDDRQHQTGFIYSIHRTGDAPLSRLLPIEVEFDQVFREEESTNVLAEEIALRPDGRDGAGFYAD